MYKFMQIWGNCLALYILGENIVKGPDKYLPSTWNRGEINTIRLSKNTLYLLNYIKENKELPDMEEWHKQDNEKWGVK